MAERENSAKPDKVRFHVFPDDRFVDLTLYQFGWEKCESRHSYGPHIRNHYLFHYIISGKGTLEAAGSDKETRYYELHAGQGFLISPGQVTHYYADAEEPWEYTWIEFDGLRAKETLELSGLDLNHPVFNARSRDMAAHLQELMLYIVDHGEETTMNLTGYAFLFLDQLHKSSTNARQENNRRVRDFYLREALNYIEQHYAEDVSVEDIASFCGLSRSYFGRIFNDVMGKTPQEFLRNYRITKACQLLKSTRMMVKDVGTAVGYPNQLHFSRAFKEVIGSSPREWRNQHFEL